MKPNFKIMNLRKLLFLPLIVFAFLVSCQNEETDITNPDQEETIAANSSTAVLMSKTASNDGSFDNIVDFANCLEVVLPVTVTANGVTITIENYNDYDAFEELLDAFDNDNDEVVISFPITLILTDYTEIVINNQIELDAQIELCNDENEDDDDIECIDFQYPISISVYDSNFQVAATVVIENDEALYTFINSLNGGVLASLNYPVTMVLSDGSTIIVNSNQELDSAILSAEYDCDEDDDYDWNDDDDFDCPNLQANVGDYCQTATVAFGIVNENCNCVEDTSPLSCLQGETIVKCDENNDGFEVFNLYEGLSEISGCTSNNQVQVSYHETIVDAENNTNPLASVTSYTNTTSVQTIYVRVQLLNNASQFDVLEIELILEDCSNTTCSEAEISAYVVECIWNVVSYNNTNDLIVYDFDFNADGTVLITGNGQTITSMWSTSTTASGIGTMLEFSNVGAPTIQVIAGNWLIIECAPDRLEMELNNDDIMVMEQDCN